MPIPAIVGILASVLGGSMNKKDEDANKVQFQGRNSNTSTPATIGSVTQPQQQPQQQSSGFDKFQGGVSKVMAIANLLNSLSGNSQPQQAHQVQFNRYRR